MEISRNDWNGLTWMKMADNGKQLLEIAGMARNVRQWLEMD